MRSRSIWTISTRRSRAVREGRADFHSGLFYSDPRSAYLDFSSGFLDDTLSLFVLDRLDVQSVSDLAATPVVVGVSRDHYAAEYMQYNYACCG